MIIKRYMTGQSTSTIVVLFFFFQAEDGIRYLVRSRGLGLADRPPNAGGMRGGCQGEGGPQAANLPHAPPPSQVEPEEGVGGVAFRGEGGPRAPLHDAAMTPGGGLGVEARSPVHRVHASGKGGPRLLDVGPLHALSLIHL